MAALIASILTGSASSPGAVAAGAVAPPEQLRAYWADAFGEGFYDAGQVERLVADVKAANMNAIFAQVVRRADCFCLRSALPRTEAPIAPGFDPLQALIDRAHAEGIEVHAWVIVTGVWRGTTAPKDPGHAFNLHGPSAGGRDYWLTRRSDGAERLDTEHHLDPGHPDAADFMVAVATDLVARYDVDGINLDRIRYPDGNLGGLPSWGYNPTALAEFQRATGRGDVPAPGDPQWTQWRRDRITDIVRRIYVQSYAIRPGVRVSVDTVAYGHGPQAVGGWERTRTYRELLQDWAGWMREGIVDLNVLMNYKRDSSAEQAAMYAEWASFAVQHQYGRHAAIGSALYLNDIAGSVRQVRTAVAGSAGWVGYSHRNPDDLAVAGQRSGAASRAELTRALTTESEHGSPLFATAARVPEMTWKAARAEACQPSIGPGIPPPAGVPSGLPGFHAAWYGQSGYPTLCAGGQAEAVVAFYNSGSLGWVGGRMGEAAFLGTWDPEPGQDRASALGGDGSLGSPDTDWPRFNRVAAQPHAYVGPGQVAWFTFTIQAPAAPGTYRLAIRPVIEGAAWMEDYGVFWYVTVR